MNKHRIFETSNQLYMYIKAIIAYELCGVGGFAVVFILVGLCYTNAAYVILHFCVCYISKRKWQGGINPLTPKMTR